MADPRAGQGSRTGPAHVMKTRPPDYYCGAVLRDGTGRTCRLRAGAGTDHLGVGCCKRHAGMTKNHRAAGLEAITLRNFDAWLAEHGTPGVADPVGTLTRIIGETGAWYDYVRHLVANLDIAGWEKRSKTEEGAVTIQLSVYVALLERAQDRAHRQLSDFLRLGLEERLVRLSELQGQAITAVLLGALDDLDLGDRAEDAKAAVGRRLELVAGGAA